MIDLRPWGDLNCLDKLSANLCIMGVPFDSAVSCGKGSSFAPEKIRYLSRYIPALTEEGDKIANCKIYDRGDLPINLDWGKYFGIVEAEALSLLRTGRFCMFIGGDHSVTIPLTKAFGKYYNKKKIGLIHFDAHPDLCNIYDGHSWSHACTVRRSLEDVFDIGDLAQVGIRSYEAEEAAFYKIHSELMLIRACDVFNIGWENIVDELVKKFIDYDAIYISLDIDVLDPAFAPGTGTPEAGGLTTRELMEIIKKLMNHLPIAAMDVVEVSPPLDNTNQITSWAALKIIYEVFGKVAAKESVLSGNANMESIDSKRTSIKNQHGAL